MKQGGFGWTQAPGDYHGYPQFVNFAAIADKPGFVRVIVRGPESRHPDGVVGCGLCVSIDVPCSEFQTMVLVDELSVPVPPPPPVPERPEPTEWR